VFRDNEDLIESVLTSLLRGDIGKETALGMLLDEMGRGGIVLVADAHLLDVGDALRRINYTMHTIPQDMSDAEIKNRLEGHVFITRNGRHFNATGDLIKYNYGLVWVTAKVKDAKVLAEKIKLALMRADFNGNLRQVVQVGDATFRRKK